jgi:hydrogenase-4 component F
MASAHLIWLLLTPLIASVLAVLAGRLGRYARPVLEIVHMLSVALVLVLVLIVANEVLISGEVSALNEWLRVDALAAVFVVIVGLVGFLAGLYSIGYTRHDLQIGQLDAGRLIAYYGLFHFSFPMLAVTYHHHLGVETSRSARRSSWAYGTRPALEAAWKYVVIWRGLRLMARSSPLDAVNVVTNTAKLG